MILFPARPDLTRTFPTPPNPGYHLRESLSIWNSLEAQAYLIYEYSFSQCRIRTIAWNPTGQLIATGSANRTLRIWNPERAQAKYSTDLRGHAAGIEKVLFNPVRDSELASCSTDGTVRIWDVRSKSCVSQLDVGGEAFTMSWSADGSVMMVGRKVSLQFPQVHGQAVVNCAAQTF